MSFERIDLRQSSHRRDAQDMERAVCRTVDALREGKVVVLPTETVYGLAARAYDSEAVEKLVRIKNRREGHPLPLAFSNVLDVSDFVPEMNELSLRLARRCWPGPVSLVLNVDHPSSEFHGLPENVKSFVSKGSTVSFRIPDHVLTTTVLGELNEPVVLTSANRSGKSEALSCEEVIAEFESEVDLYVDDGPLIDAKPSTVVQIDGDDRYSILRAGTVREETIRRLTARMILFVCTGNTCRSPMAERICEKLIARRLGCSVERLEEHGFVVLSAGLAAGYEMPASHQAVEVLNREGLDLTDHRSQQLNETHVRFADHIFTMTRGHREAILSYWPGADTRLSVLRNDGGDVSDPIGGPQSVYEQCARQLESEIERRLDEIGIGA